MNFFSSSRSVVEGKRGRGRVGGSGYGVDARRVVAY